MADEAWALMKEVSDKRQELGEALGPFREEVCKMAFLDATNGKLKFLNQHLAKELAEEKDLATALARHIAGQDAADLNESAEGFGTDELKMGKVILNRLPENIAITEEIYREKFGRTLEDCVMGENTGLTGLSHFGKFLACRTRSQPKRDGVLFNEAMAGMGTADKVLVEMLSTRTNAELVAAGDYYAELHGQTLKATILGETTGFGSGWYGSWMQLLVDFDCDEGTEPAEDCEGLAKSLYEAGAGAGMFSGTDEQKFLDVLAKASTATCQAIATAYEAMDETENTLLVDIEKLLGGDFEYAVIARVKPRMDFLCHRLLKACEGWGTDEDCICRVLGCLSNTEVMELAARYNELYSAEKEEPLNDFKSMIASELGGDFLEGIVGMLEALPPKSHWEQEVTYLAKAETNADEFKELVKEKWGDSKAAIMGSADNLDGELQLINIPDENVFVSPGFDYPISTANGKFDREDIAYAMGATPESEETATEIRDALQALLDGLQGEIDQTIVDFELAKEEHFGLVRDMRSKDALLSRYLIDTAGMLEFSAQRDADALHEAVDGWGTDEDKLINVLCGMSKRQLKRVNQIYQEKYEKTIRQVCDEELGGFFEGDFKYFLKCSMDDPAEVDAELFRDSMKGFGTDDALLCELLCTRTNAELEAAKKAFKKQNGKSLQSWVEYDTSGEGMYSKFLLECLKAKRNEGFVSSKKAAKDAATLRQSGLGEGDLSEEPFLKILPYAGEEQVQLIKASFQEQFGEDMVEAVKTAMDGGLWDSATLGPLLCRMTDSATYYAEVLNKAFKGMGTDETTVSRVIGRNSKADLKHISARYKELYSVTLKEAIESEIGGNFQKALIVYLKEDGIGKTLNADEIEVNGMSISKAVGQGFLSACWAEYVKEEEGAIGTFMEGDDVQAGMIALTLKQNDIIDAEDKEACLTEIAGQWGVAIDQ